MAPQGRPDVTVEGERTVTVTDAPSARDRFGWSSREFAIHCHTGRVIEGRWTGFPVGALTEAARPPAETTHLLVTGRDGHTACVPASVVPGALLGFVRETVAVAYPDEGESYGGPGAAGDGSGEGGRDDDTRRPTEGTPRFLAEGVNSSHTVRDVAAIEAVTLDPAEDPRSYETSG